MKKLITSFFLSFSLYTVHAQTISTVAGGGNANPGDGGLATDCELDSPTGIVVDAAGNYYFTERDRHRVRKVATDGTITTIAGTGVAGYDGDGGAATAARLKYPYSITIDAVGNIYIGDAAPSIRKITTTGTISTYAGNGVAGFSGDGGPAILAEMNGPSGMAFDVAGNLYIADKGNNRIRKITPTGIISTYAGTGAGIYNGDNIPATDANLGRPAGVFVDADGNILISDSENNRIRKVVPTGIISTVAGSSHTIGFSGDGGPATAAKLNEPYTVVADNAGNILIGDTFNNRIRRVGPDGTISTIAGNGGGAYTGDGSPATAYRVGNPVGMAVKADGSLLVCDFLNDRIRLITNVVAVHDIKSTPVSGSLTVFPNPSSGRFSVRYTGTPGMQHISVSDIAGKVLKEIVNVSDNVTYIDISGTPPGLYFVAVHTSAGDICGRVVVDR